MPDCNTARFRDCGWKHVQERSHEFIVLRTLIFANVNQSEISCQRVG